MRKLSTENLQKLVDAMAAGVALVDGTEAVSRQLLAEGGVGAQRGEMAAHPGAVARNEIILAGREEPFAIVPGCANQGDAAGERFENANRGDTGQIQGVQAAGDMHGEGVLRENLRGAVIGQPAAVPDAVAGERREGLFGIAYAISPGAKAKDADGFEEEFAELGGAFVVA